MNAVPKPTSKPRKRGHITNRPPYEGAVCWACGCNNTLQTHEIFGGANRNLSISYDLQVILCAYHHDMVHARDGKRLKDDLHKLGQTRFEQTHTREKFMKLFGKSWL
jgi:hypothetical protein